MINSINYLFKKVGDPKQVAKWVDKFSKCDLDFAVVKLGGATIDNYENDIIQDLAVLSKLDLYVPVVYGWGNAFTKKLSDNNIKSEFHFSGDRITKKEDLPYLEEVAYEQGSKIVSGLKERGVLSEIVYGVFGSEKKNLEGVNEHYTGNITAVNTDKIISYLKKGILPLIPPLGYDSKGQVLNNNADIAGKIVVCAYKPKKYISVMAVGGILDENKKIISNISLHKDYARLMENGVSGGAKVKLREIKEIFDIVQKDDFSAQITHPKNLLIELFTDKGFGTYIGR